MTLATFCCVLAALAYGWKRSRTADSSATVVVAALTALIFTMLYVLPWYTMWVLPTAATRLRGRSTVAAWVLASSLLVAYNAPPGVRVSPGFDEVDHLVLPVALVALVVLSIFLFFYRRPPSWRKGAS